MTIPNLANSQAFNRSTGRFSPRPLAALKSRLTIILALAGLLLIGAAANSRAEGTSTLIATDAAGSSSFNAVGHWSGGLAPGPGTNFFTDAFTLRTPANAGNYAFLGDSLTIGSGGSLAVKGGSGNTITFNNLTNSGTISDAINPNTITALAGNMTVVNGATFNTSSGSGDVRTITNGLTMFGTGTVTNTSTIGAYSGVVVYTADNTAWTGPMVINNNQTVQAGALNNLGGNPASFNPAQLLLDNGTFQALASFSLNNANNGVTLNPGGGAFTTASGISLTIAEPITGPGALTVSGGGTLILTGSNSYTNGTTVSAGILNVQNNFGLGTNGTVSCVNRNGGIQLQGGVNIPAAVNFTLSNDGTSGAAVPCALDNLSGNNTINGAVTVTIGGGNAAIQSDSGALVIAGILRIANGQSSRGFNLQGVSTAANTISGAITNGTTGSNSITKNGSGNWTLSGTNLYAGPTIVNGGTLFLSGNGSISYSPLISVASGATFDVSGLSSTFTLGAGQSISNSVGTVNGSIATVAGSSIYPATVGVAGTLAFNGNLDLSAGGIATFDLDTTAAGNNDSIVVGGALTLSSSDRIHINAMSGYLDTADYTLFSVSTGTTMASTPALVWDGAVPGNYLNYSLLQIGNNVVLHYSSATSPSVYAFVTPASATRNQAVTVTANVTRGDGNIVGVTVDLTQIGGSATAGLVLDSADSTPPTYVYTNTFLVAAGTSLGDQALAVTATDDSSPTPLTGTYIITPYTITANAVTWDGGGADNKWTSNANWTSDIGPGLIGDSITFSGNTQLTPDMDTNYSVTSLTFDGAAGAFTLGSSTGGTLTSGGDIVNNSSSAQTLNMPVVTGAAQTFNAVSGDLTFSSSVSLGGNTLTVDGSANTAIGGVISGTGGLTMNGYGTLVLSNANTFTGTLNLAAGTLVIGNDSAAGTGTLNFNGPVSVTFQSVDGTAHTITNALNFGGAAGANTIFAGTGNLLFTRSASNGSAKTMTVNNPVTEFSGVLSGNMARTVAGTGRLIYSGANTYNQGTTINPGATLQLGNGGTNGSLSASGVIDDEGTLIFNRSDALVQGTHFSSAPIIGYGSVVQAGSGTTMLNAANTYYGSTIVNNGELFITPGYQMGGNVVVADGASFGVFASSVSNSAAVGNLNLGAVGATTLDFSYGLVGNPTNVALTANAVTISGSSTVRVGGSLAVGTFPVLKYGSLSGAFADTVAGPRGVTATLSNDVVNQVIYVTVSSVGGGIVWTGTNSVSPNLWDLNSTTNWLIGGLPADYIETVPPGDAVTFNDLGSGLVLLSNTVSPAGITISNASVNYAFQGTGQINCLGGLTKVGAASVTLNVPATFIGNTVISNGTFNIGASQTFANLSGNSAINVSAGTPTLTVNDTSDTTFAGNVTGALGLTKTGAGVLTMTGSNVFSGNLFVSLGTLTLDSGFINLNNFCSIGLGGTDNGTLTLKGTENFTGNNDFNVGDVGAAVGTLNVQDNASLTINSLFIGSANAAGSTASGTVNQTGGTVTQLTSGAGTFCIGGRVLTTSVGGIGVYNMSGGTLVAASGIRVGSAGPGTFNQSGGTVIPNGDLNIARFAGSTGIYNLDGGTLITPDVTSSTSANATFNFNGGVLLAAGSTTTFVQSLSQANVRNGGAVVDTTNFNVSISQVLQHSYIGGDNAVDGGLTKRGSGTLNLTGFSSSYTGPTVVTGGLLNLANGSVANLNSLTLNNGALGLTMSYGSGTFYATDVNLSGNSALNINYDLLLGAPATALAAYGNLTASGMTVINVSGYGFTAGQQCVLVSYTGIPLANLNNFRLGVLPVGMVATLSNNVANASIDLVITGAGSITSWIPLAQSDALGTSSFNSGLHWLDGNPPTAGNGYFTRAFTLRSPADANPYTFGGDVLSIDAGGQLLFKGTDGQAITVGNLVLNGGLVDFGVSTSDNFTETLAGTAMLQSGTTNTMAANGSANTAETLNVTAPINGAGNLQINGISGNLGTIVLAANNAYTGATTVAGGTLLVNGAVGNSPITVNPTGALGGIGSIAGPIVVQSGGTLAPGIPARGALTAAIGTLTAGNTIVAGTVQMKIDRSAVPTSDKLVASSVVIDPGAILTVNNVGSASLVAGDTFTLFSTPVTGSFSTITLPALPDGSVTWTNKLAINGTIEIIASTAINTNSPYLTTSVSGGNLNLSWPVDHIGWTLQMQTNSLAQGLGTNWVDVPGSTATNAVSIPITTTNGAVFYRLTY